MMSDSSESTRPSGQVVSEELLEAVILHITPLCFLLHLLFKVQVHVFEGQVKIVFTLPTGQLQY